MEMKHGFDTEKLWVVNGRLLFSKQKKTFTVKVCKGLNYTSHSISEVFFSSRLKRKSCKWMDVILEKPE